MPKFGKEYQIGSLIFEDHGAVGTDMKIQEIRAKAKALRLNNTFGLSKRELIRRIQRTEGNFDCFGTAKTYCDQFECCFREDCLKPTGTGRK